MLTRSVYVYNAIFRVRFAYTRYYLASVRTTWRKNFACKRWVAATVVRVREIDEKREETGGGIYLLTFDK